MSLCNVCLTTLPSFPTHDASGNSISIWRTGVRVVPRAFFTDINHMMHLSWDSLIISLNQDCPICWSIWRFIRSSPIASPYDERVLNFYSFMNGLTYDSTTAEYGFLVRLRGTSPGKNHLNFAVKKTTEECYQNVEKLLPITSEPTPASTADSTRDWIKACDEKHAFCNKRGLATKDARMPTRLLDVGNNDSKTWHVVETEGRVPYVALSHRWSKHTPRLLRSNVRSYHLPQDDAILPQNYQDIISTCRAIPIRYLWIDSLCILQDDVDGLDFRREAPLMMDIYQYAILTMMICWDSPETTLFRRRNPRSIPRLPWPRRVLDISKDYPGPMCAPGNYAFVDYSSDFKMNVAHAPINTRGWVLQERCLSRRILYLSNDQLFWECDGSIHGFVAKEAVPGFTFDRYQRQSIYRLPHDERETCWPIIVQMYSVSNLTYEQDRLVAIAGLAKVAARLTGDTYLAGIWLRYWMSDICWAPWIPRNSTSKSKPANKNKQTLQPRTDFTAPSWSWLDFPGQINMVPIYLMYRQNLETSKLNTFQSELHRPLAILTDHIIDSPEGDPFVSFDRAILKVRCLMIPLEFGKGYSEFPLGSSLGLWRENDIEPRSEGWGHLRLVAPSEWTRDRRLEMNLSRPLNSSLRHFFLPLWLEKSGFGSASQLNFNEARTCGVLVQETVAGGNSEYHRIGTLAEDTLQSTVLSPVISNTIVKLGIGKECPSTDGAEGPEEREFEFKLGDFAATQSSGSKKLDLRAMSSKSYSHTGKKSGDGESRDRRSEESDGGSGDSDGGMVECSLLPYFATAQWTTISLV